MSRSPFPKTAEALQAVGIEPGTVSIEGFTADGYNVFLHDHKGRAIFSPDGRRTLVRLQFATPELGQALHTIYLAERAEQEAAIAHIKAALNGDLISADALRAAITSDALHPALENAIDEAWGSEPTA